VTELSTDKNTHNGDIKAVTFFTNHGEDPCAHLRLRGPMKQLGINVLDGNIEGNTHPDLVYAGDVVVIQRNFPADFSSYQQITQIARAEKKPIIYDIDDLLLLMPEYHPERESQFYVESLLPMLEALYEADLITTTTPLLKEKLLQFNENVKVLPNYFDDEIWHLRKPNLEPITGTPLILGYMGSESHMPDVLFVEPLLKNLLNKYPEKLEMHFWGIKPPLSIANFPNVKWFPAVSYEYVDFAADFQTQSADIFIAPLIDNLFNRSKSPIKYFEYSALGVPGVYSKLETFEQVITHGENGFLASSLQEWQEFLELLINNRELRQNIAISAQKNIMKNWLLSENAYRWKETYQEARQKNLLTTKPIKTNVDVIQSLNQQYFAMNQARNELLAEKTKTIQDKEQTILTLSAELTLIKTSRAWKIVLFIRRLRDIIAPPDTLREKIVNTLFQWLNRQKARRTIKKRKARLETLLNTQSWMADCLDIPVHKNEIDIIVCVHNALEDVNKCLNSIISQTQQPYALIIVDDGSDTPTQEYLEQFAETHHRCKLIRNNAASGYTKAANIGMKASEAPFLVLLNSDTIVTPEWVDRLFRALKRDPKNGVVGPLSNTASWQSIPKLSENGDWAINVLDNGITPEIMGKHIASYSACIHPVVPLLNGFCMMIRREVINEIGYFDEDTFGQGYGEEDDFNLRAINAGWNLVIADDAYVYHAQSKSYTHEKRYALQKQSGEKLLNKHGADLINESVGFMNPNRVMEGIRARSEIMLEREAYIRRGKSVFAGKKILFVLPVLDAGGGANVILDEAKCMKKMGIDVGIFNLPENKSGFLENYAHIDTPFIFAKIQDLPEIASGYDAVVASANYSVPWLKPLVNLDPQPILGYYVQGFEALMYKEGTEEYSAAIASYSLISDIKRFTKTEWTRKTVLEQTGADSSVVGISVNFDLFRPRDMVLIGVKPVTIVAMIRPGSAYRNPQLTLSILKQIEKKYGNVVDIWLFGANDVREVVESHYLNFKWRQMGKLTQVQVASMMSKADIFTDFSSHQAMGLAALEAMSAGCSVIVPKHGGAVEFINHKVNGIVADTSISQASQLALEELIENDGLRQQVQLHGIRDVVQYYPEKVSYNILSTLFLR